MAYHVSKAKFGELVEAALAELPEQFAEHIEELAENDDKLLVGAY